MRLLLVEDLEVQVVRALPQVRRHRLRERGMPFEEMEASGYDVDITWKADDAEIGIDALDPVVTEKSPTVAVEPPAAKTSAKTPPPKVKTIGP